MWSPWLTVTLVNLVGLCGLITSVVAFRRRRWRSGTVYLACSLTFVFLSVFAADIADARPISQAAVSVFRYASLFLVLGGILYSSWWIVALTLRLLWNTAKLAWRLIYTIASPAYFLLADLFTTLKIGASNQQSDVATTTYFERPADWTMNLKVGIFVLLILCLPTVLNRALDTLRGTTVITNFLDLISLVLVTPKLFNARIRATFTPFHITTAKLLSAIWLPYISLAVTAPFDKVLSHDIDTNSWMMPKFAELTLSFEMAQMTRLWHRASAFYFYLTMIVSAFVVCVLLLNYKISDENENDVADKALMWGVVVFVYSRCSRSSDDCASVRTSDA